MSTDSYTPAYRDDPRWLAARDRLIAEDGDPDVLYAQQIQAAIDMRAIEKGIAPPIECTYGGRLHPPATIFALDGNFCTDLCVSYHRMSELPVWRKAVAR